MPGEPDLVVEPEAERRRRIDRSRSASAAPATASPMVATGRPTPSEPRALDAACTAESQSVSARGAG
ncbi:MAG TPA: hypothetical protein VGM56_26830, partial [Byssovorax sp.]